jgi:hypothetical protein
MSDDTLRARLRDAVARLAPSQDGDASPQARDERPIAIGREEHTQEPDKEDIERATDEYYQNPLIRQPVRNFAADVVEPGYRVDVSMPEDGDEPTVPEDYRFAEFRGMGLSDALEAWLSTAAIIGGRFDRDFSDLLEDLLIDLRGRRGTALVEHAYDDPREREYILGLRAFKAEETTAYHRSGKRILLQPDDAEMDSETVAIKPGGGDQTRFDDAPTTPAGRAAAFVQYDDILGSYNERDDIPFALDDVTVLSNDPDTGAIFGDPDTLSVIDRSEQLREMFSDTAQAIKAVGYGHWIVNVDTDDEDEARALLDSFDPTDPERVNVTNYAAEAEQFDSDVPSNVDHIQQQIEYILSALPTPLYRVGFAGGINRDVTSVQQDDYREEVSRARDRLESAFHDLLHQKAREFLFGDAKADREFEGDVSLVIEPPEAENPLNDEAVDPDEFASLMQGLKAGAPGGAVEQVVPPHEMRETFLGLSPEPPEAPDADEGAAMALPDETDERVRETFEDAYLARQYSEGDVVQSPQGLGVVTGVETDPFTGKNDEEIDASDSSPTYIVGLKDARVGVGFYSASELDSAEMPDTGVDDPTAALAAPDPDGDAALVETTFGIPDSWEDSPKPNRLILLDAWASMGGTFRGARRELGSNRLAASMKDRVLQWEGWREGG